MYAKKITSPLCFIFPSPLHSYCDCFSRAYILMVDVFDCSVFRFEIIVLTYRRHESFWIGLRGVHCIDSDGHALYSRMVLGQRAERETKNRNGNQHLQIRDHYQQ